MDVLRRVVMAVGGISVIALVAGLAAPKAVHAIVATAVQVVNTATSPALTSSVDDPGRTAYQSTLTGECFSGCTFQFPTIPAGHRVVIQHISGFARLDGPAPGVTVIVHGGPTGILGAFFDPVSTTVTTGTSDFDSVFDQPVLFYFDAGQNPAVEFQIQQGTFPLLFNSNTVTITGYELTCSAATPCAAIAQ
jgi:hypothetical protein